LKLVKENIETKCHHCGEECRSDSITVGENTFCCLGCKTVYEILNGNDLCNYYTLDNYSGVKIKDIQNVSKFDYLDDKDIQDKLIEFKNKEFSSVTFFVPTIHCSSCIWLLEKLYKINPSVLSSSVNFPEKKVKITFNSKDISLKEVVKLLASIGYEPLIKLDSHDKEIKDNSYTKKLYLKIGVAGFCLGNIMLLSFPEYLSINNYIEGNLKTIFNYLNILLSIPVIFYCASDYFSSAWKGLKKKFINIDLPVSLGLLALFFRSLYEIFYFNNAGFSDSLAGLVFLLLLGKLFQNKTYETLNFERDYRSYFPICVTVKLNKTEKSIPVSKLKAGDRIIIRNNEIVPADAILFNGKSNIDYSFVTGESVPEQKVLGEIIYAGGRHMGSAIELEVIRTVSHSYLTQLWNDRAFVKKTDINLQNAVNTVSKYFTFAILAIAFGSAIYWYNTDINLALNAFTTVLIIACPCALALTTPFALGNTMRIFGRNKFYLKNANVTENLSKIDTIVFDKTGTITNTNDITVEYTGTNLNLCELAMVKSLSRNSFHPLSKAIYDSINLKIFYEIENYRENLSEGISCDITGKNITLGTIHYILKEIDSTEYIFNNEYPGNAFSTNVYLAIDKKIKGYYSFRNKYRDGLKNIISDLSEDYKMSVISGDNNAEKYNLQNIFSFKNDEQLLFNQTPAGKLNYIRTLQNEGHKVLMIGDGLNDAGALKQSDAGISVSENITNFSPASDAIIDASEFSKISEFLKFSRTTMKIIKVSFAVAFLYNAVGLYLAAQGTFSPLIAAILMPFNSISIILFVTGATNYFAKRRKLL